LSETEDTASTDGVDSAEPRAAAESGSDEGSDPVSGEAKSADPPAEDPLAKALAEATKFKDAWMRTAADFDNFRKRSRRELEDARKAGREELLKDLLPTFDNLERAVVASKSATDVKGVVDGILMVMKQFEATLGRMNITKVTTVGNMFDPQVHEAIQQVETDEHPPGTVIAEVQPGYLNGERLVRAAMVVVAKPKAAEAN
jgi:molecular chaperone GrpE